MGNETDMVGVGGSDRSGVGRPRRAGCDRLAFRW
jgi:hypothetical protein